MEVADIRHDLLIERVPQGVQIQGARAPRSCHYCCRAWDMRAHRLLGRKGRPGERKGVRRLLRPRFPAGRLWHRPRSDSGNNRLRDKPGARWRAAATGGATHGRAPDSSPTVADSPPGPTAIRPGAAGSWPGDPEPAGRLRVRSAPCRPGHGRSTTATSATRSPASSSRTGERRPGTASTSATSAAVTAHATAGVGDGARDFFQNGIRRRLSGIK